MAWFSKKQVEEPSAYQVLLNAQIKYEKTWLSSRKAIALKELIAAAEAHIKDVGDAQEASFKYGLVSDGDWQYGLLRQVAPEEYCRLLQIARENWVKISQQEVLGATSETGLQVFHNAAPELKEDAFCIVLTHALTIERAKEAYYAAGEKEPLLQARALVIWRELSYWAVDIATTYEETLAAKEDLPFGKAHNAKYCEALDLALARCKTPVEVVDWLRRFASGYSKEFRLRQAAGARKLLELVEEAEKQEASA
jgi:hypothetical protein